MRKKLQDMLPTEKKILIVGHSVSMRLLLSDTVSKDSDVGYQQNVAPGSFHFKNCYVAPVHVTENGKFYH